MPLKRQHSLWKSRASILDTNAFTSHEMSLRPQPGDEREREIKRSLFRRWLNNHIGWLTPNVAKQARPWATPKEDTADNVVHRGFFNVRPNLHTRWPQLNLPHWEQHRPSQPPCITLHNIAAVLGQGLNLQLKLKRPTHYWCRDVQ